MAQPHPDRQWREPARKLPWLLCAALLWGCSDPVSTSQPDLPAADGKRLPVSTWPLPENDNRLRFAIVGDRTAGHRPGVFRQAMQQLNNLQPEFVISVGDLIEGYSRDPEVLQARWDEVNAKIASLDMPFFYVMGNNDASNPEMADWWHQHLGASHYHFVHGNALFLVLNSEDPPTAQTRRDALQNVDPGMLQRAMRALRAGPAVLRRMTAEEPELTGVIATLRGDLAGIGEAQLEDMRQALAAHTDVQWTFVFMHKPAWRYDVQTFLELETLLADRPYTVFAGHYHYYLHEERHGRDYIQLGATGGMRGAYATGPGDMDHVTWVTLTERGPEIANINLEGLSGREGPGRGATIPRHTPSSNDGETP